MQVKVLGNGVLLLVGLLVLALWALVQFDSARVDRAGIDFTRAYESYFAQSQSAALAALDQDDPTLALAWLDQQSQTQPGDRLYPMKRALRIRLLDRFDANEAFREMLVHAQAWHAEAERDISAKAYRLRALSQTPGHKKESEGLLEIEARRFPRNAALARFNAAADPPWRSGWVVFWDLGGGFDARHHSPALSVEQYDERAFRVRATLPSDLLRLRIDPPDESRLEISKISLHSGTWEKHIAPADVVTNNMQEGAGTFRAVGAKDPNFHFALADLPRGSNPERTLEIRLEIRFLDAPSDRGTK